MSAIFSKIVLVECASVWAAVAGPGMLGLRSMSKQTAELTNRLAPHHIYPDAIE